MLDAHALFESQLLNSPQRDASIPALQRVKAMAKADFKFDGNKTRLDRLYQHASAKIRFPKTYAGPLEAVLINTAGGLTGGDDLNWQLTLAKGAQITATTQACEKAYASSFGTATVQTNLELADDAVLSWLPQETILYNNSSLSRRFDVSMASSARLLVAESLVLGRRAMGEAPKRLFFRDRWRIKRDGKLVFADNLGLNGPAQMAVQLGKNTAVSTILLLTDEDQESLEALAGKLNQLCQAPLSAFSGAEGKLTGRLLATDSYELRKSLMPLIEILSGTQLPRVWRI